MNSTLTGLIVFGCLFGAGLLGMSIRGLLPAHHFTGESKEAVRIGVGLVATMAALVLGLLVASTKSAYDNEKSEVTLMASKVVFLDRVLARYGPETAPIREGLRQSVEMVMARMWPDAKSAQAAPQLDPRAASGEALFAALEQLTPKTEAQTSLKSQALQLGTEIAQMRWLLFAQAETSISLPLLVIVVAWLAVIFGSVGLFAPANATVIVTLVLAALSVAAAIFLIAELDSPFQGIVQITPEAMQTALQHLGQ